MRELMESSHFDSHIAVASSAPSTASRWTVYFEDTDTAGIVYYAN
jgi:hypothetical protein